jgi:glycosyltransferase involved in cell wall biosynthesis
MAISLDASTPAVTPPTAHVNLALMYRDWRDTRRAHRQKRADQLRYAAANTVLANQFASITAALHAAIAAAAAVYGVELILAAYSSTSMLLEDGFVETITALVFLTAGLIGLGQFFNHRRCWISLAIGALGLMAFLDELSFGERLLGYEAPIVRGMKIDAAHDLLDLFFGLAVTRLSGTQLTVVACAMCMGAVVIAYRYRRRLHSLWGCSRAIPFIAFTALALMLAYVIDEGFENVSGLGDWVPVASFEELFEFVAAVSMACAASTRALEISIRRNRSIFRGFFATLPLASGMRCPTLTELPPPPEAVTIWPWTRGSPVLPSTLPDGSAWPLISIVTPSFNQAEFLEQAIRSVLLQGYPRLELIVIDGGSTDGTLATIAQYERWLKYWVSERDEGPANALNKGFRFASGDILGFLNADDFYLPECLAKVAKAFHEQPSADVVSGHGYFAKASGELGMPTFSDRWSFQRFRYGACILVQQATFFRRNVFEQVNGFREHANTCWDMELWADMALAGATFHSMDEFMAAFRLHAGSITGSAEMRDRRLQDARHVLEQLRGRPETSADRLLHYVHRAIKFSTHPGRTLRQRLFFYSTLKRWSL